MRRPAIRRVRDWDSSRETLPRIAPLPAPFAMDDDDDEEDKATLARFIPIDSEVRALLDDPEQTLAYIRKVRASIPDADTALDSLVSVHEDRVARLAKERAQAAAIVAYAPPVAANDVRKPTKKTPTKSVDQTLLRLQPHVWKIVYSTICVWGLIQLALTR